MITVLFFREDGFYPVELMDPESCGKSLCEQAKDHAELNPGTLSVESADGSVCFWKIGGMNDRV